MHTNLWSSVSVLQCSANGSSGYIEALLNNQDIYSGCIAALDKLFCRHGNQSPEQNSSKKQEQE